MASTHTTIPQVKSTAQKLSLTAKIKNLKKEKNAIIIAHYYQQPEIQDVADSVGDSLKMAQYAATTDADILLVAGVYFMAETAIKLRKT